MELVKPKVEPLNESPDMNYFYRRLQYVIFEECKDLDIYLRYAQMELMTDRVRDYIKELENDETEIMEDDG